MSNTPQLQPWTLLIVDDEAGLHDVSKLVLKRLSFGGRPVKILSAYSAQEARKIIEEGHDIAVALIDVVMEDDQAGLTLVRDMREHYGMSLTRIILRTGNPGLAPEREVIQYFQIDDYRDKTELTSDRLYTSVYTALRAYQTLTTLEQTAEGLEQIIKSSGNIQAHESFHEFLDALIKQLVMVAGVTRGLLLVEDIVAAGQGQSGPTVLLGMGRYKSWESKSLAEVADQELISIIEGSFHQKDMQVLDNGISMSIDSPNQNHFVIWLPTLSKPEPHVLRLLRIFLEKFKLNVENARLHEEILDAQRTALSKLCEAVEMRSKETGQHIYRMAKYSRLLAKLHGLPSDQVQLIEAAAPLHDIGKVAIPDLILNKPGALNLDEMQVMRSHAQNGWDLLCESNSEMLRLGAEIALTHHERWDGSGYPRKLKGEEIPLHGRIVSIADVFDALMSKRVYKEAFPIDKTIAMMTEMSGKAFDPELMNLLIENKEQFESIFIENPDQVN